MKHALLCVLFAVNAIAPAKKALVDELLKMMAAPADAAAAYDQSMTEQQLRDTIAFFKTDSGKSFLKAFAGPAKPVDDAEERAKVQRTKADMRLLATAAEAYDVDENKFPPAKDLDALQQILSPAYVLRMPRTDAWDTQFAYVVSDNGHVYRFVSAGPDKKFSPSSLVIGTKADKTSDDIVLENGAFVQAPKS